MYEPGLTVKKASEKHVEDIADMMIRFYRFNEEFDPAYAVREDVRSIAVDYVEESIKRDDVLLLVACWNGKPVGFLRAEIRGNRMLRNSRYGTIVELYVKPRFRRQGIASMLIREAGNAMSSMGISILSSQFPAMNVIAKQFYEKHGFRPWTHIYIHEV
ncbi:MAG: GNAT family N-acetyltransferase [Desulfurococcales archaeon]|nr:GNAT family N-acetyltransferase [Desulfurococcales archaeon]